MPQPGVFPLNPHHVGLAYNLVTLGNKAWFAVAGSGTCFAGPLALAKSELLTLRAENGTKLCDRLPKTVIALIERKEPQTTSGN